MKYTVDIVTENKPGVLYRIAGLLTKRKINIERINAYTVKNNGISKIFFTAEIEDRIVDTLVKQIYKIIEVIEIKYHKVSH
ncbi:MAG: putative acetolactate synthase small subunit [Candidatus Roizmanbacteria bacterium GW2011_GWA2_35_19]|uniref:Acetolactate synthase small subunit n=2 Tax=Candidatus Roizmaniibacteriota TaxID=1752723 RepID=A0A0G0CAH8_9BACT|nr:MAG: putative acetolactate synthase small subunit [Candidatus Roizmanbacteria bacterium GW2011_GWC2_35_12]KKP73111.1 MAG: putative acetolactate synthase small subunit [Candidatus Roizmanbacteria bacterium GW2011_GWA2_35_19]